MILHALNVLKFNSLHFHNHFMFIIIHNTINNTIIIGVCHAWPLASGI